MSDDIKKLEDIENKYNDDFDSNDLSEDDEVTETEETLDDEIDVEEEKTKEDAKKDKELLEKHIDQILPINLSTCMQDSFLSYAMSVIVARALPDVRDGLKPVQRRILYTMNELGVFSDKPFKKSARIVGDVMGKYHPHGDSAIYEATVRMAQDFSYRYTLVEGHGNFGSVDGDGAAHMRYTEARLSKISGEILKDLNKNTVDFTDNYDGTEQEPVVLPCKFPNILVNGASGIAVGMATSIPTHNLNEVINATLAMIENPDITVSGLMDYIQAPDFPTGGIIMGLSSVREAYETGIGTVTCRAKVDVEELSNGKKEILVREIPYQVNKRKLIERIAELAKDKIIDGITDLRDESSMKGMKVVIEIRRDVNANVILNNLYKYTPMQTTYSVNMIALDHGQPKCLNLKQILECYIKHQIEVVTRRTEFDLEKAKARLHIVEGLLIALANIDEVVATIKASKSTEEAVSQLIAKFILTEIQAKSILDMKLQRLTGLEIEKLKLEEKELKDLVEYLQSVLDDHSKLMSIIVSELKEVQNKYGDERKSQIDLSEDLEVADEDLIPVEDVIITITNKGYIKRLTVDSYKVQKRAGKGVTGTKMQEEDFVEKIMYTSTHDNILFFTNFGQVYNLKAYQIPTASRFSKGLPVVNLLKFDTKEKLAAVINVKSLDEPGFIIFGTKKGNIKKTALSKYQNIRSTGIRALLLNDDDEIISVQRSNGDQRIILGASNGKAVCFDEIEVRPTNRNAAGVKAIKLEGEEHTVGMAIVSTDNDEVTVLTEKGFGKRCKAGTFKVKGRNGKGVKYLNITQKSGLPVALSSSTSEDDLIVVTDKGMVIRIQLKDISMIGRDTQGVCIIKLNEGHKVASITVVPSSANGKDVGSTNNDTETEETTEEVVNVDNVLSETDDYFEDESEDNEEEIIEESVDDF